MIRGQASPWSGKGTSFKKVAARVVPLACLLLICGLATVQSDAQQAPLLADADAGVERAKVQDQLLSLSNRMMEAQWSVREGKLAGLKFVIQGTGAEVELPRDPFLPERIVAGIESLLQTAFRIKSILIDTVQQRQRGHRAQGFCRNFE